MFALLVIAYCAKVYMRRQVLQGRSRRAREREANRRKLMKNSLGTIHRHLLGGPDAKRVALKFFSLILGLEKITTNFPKKIESTWNVIFCGVEP